MEAGGDGMARKKSSKSSKSRKKASNARKDVRSATKSQPRETHAPLPDRRSMERMWADLHALLADQNFESVEAANEFLQGTLQQGPLPRATPQNDLARAQDVMYDAFDARGSDRARLARKALSISPDCADAYVLLAEEEAQTDEEALRLYQEGVEAGERALGEDAFEELKGHFWGFIETRPYMRARAGLAMRLWRMGRRKEAVEHLHAMLELNPNDNQGLRAVLCLWLLDLRRHEELQLLLDKFPEDGMLEMLWARAIWTFCTTGAGHRARRRVREALHRNPRIMGFLLGVTPFPGQMGQYITVGGEDEAANTAMALIPLLNKDEETSEWLLDELEAALDAPGTGVNPHKIDIDRRQLTS